MKTFGKKTDSSRRRQLADEGQQPSFSYNASRRSEEASNVGRGDRRAQKQAARSAFWSFWMQRSGMIILIIVIGLCVISVLSLSSNAKVLPLTSDKSVSLVRSEAAYQSAANKLLASSLWNRNKLTIDTGSISRQMVAQFPELSSASVTLPLLAHRPVIYLQPTQPALILAAHNGTYVIGTNGKALLASDRLAPGHNLPQITDGSGIDVKLNHQVLTPGDIGFIQSVLGQLAAKHISVSSMDLPPAASELDVHIAGKPYFVKFNLQNDDARQQAGTLLATLALLQRQHVTPAHYIDVRVDGRAYYQ